MALVRGVCERLVERDGEGWCMTKARDFLLIFFYFGFVFCFSFIFICAYAGVVCGWGVCRKRVFG